MERFRNDSANLKHRKVIPHTKSKQVSVLSLLPSIGQCGHLHKDFGPKSNIFGFWQFWLVIGGSIFASGTGKGLLTRSYDHLLDLCRRDLGFMLSSRSTSATKLPKSAKKSKIIPIIRPETETPKSMISMIFR